MNLPILGVSFIFKGREKTLECVYERKFIADKLWAYLVAFNSCQRRGMVANNPPWGAIIIMKCAVLGCEMQLFN